MKGSGQGTFFENYARFRLFLRQEQFSFFHEVDIELMDAKEGWAPFMSLGDAQIWMTYVRLHDGELSKSPVSWVGSTLSRPWMFDEISLVDDR